MGADPSRAHPLAAVALTIAMCAMFALMDSLVRWLGALLPVLALLTWRYGTQAVVMGLWLARGGRRRFASTRPGFQALRGVLLLATSTLSFFALQHMPVAEFTAVMLLGPVFVTLLSAVMLQEPAGPLRWALLVLSLLGALVVIRPGSGLFGFVALLPLAGALSYAFFQVLTRRFALSEDPLATHFWTGAVGTAVLLPVLLASGSAGIGPWLALTGVQWLAVFAVGLLGTCGHLLLVLAARLAPPSTLMPFIYLQLGFASLFGWLIFARLPDFWGWVGMAVIAASGAASAWLNLRRAALPAPSAAPAAVPAPRAQP